MSYEFDGKKYEKSSTHQKEWGDRIISEFDLTGHESILDLGCGSGALTENLAKLVPNGNVLGIDASKGMINVAKEKEQNNLKFILMDINYIRLDEKFDLIFSNATLHWIKDHKKLWVAIEKLLNPSGIIRFNFAADGNCSHFFKIIKKTIACEEYKKYFTDFVWPWYMPTLGKYESMLKSLSVSNTKVWGENADRYFPDKEAMIGWINQPSIVPLLKYIPEEKKEIFRACVVEQMVNATLQEDGQCFEMFRRINVLVKK